MDATPPTLETLLVEDVKELDKRDPVGNLYGWLRGEAESGPVVFDGDRPYGIVNDGAVLRSRLDARQRPEPYVLSTGVLDVATPPGSALRTAAHAHAGHLPAPEEGKLRGVARTADLLALLDHGPDARHLLLEVPTVTSATSVGEPVHLLHRTASPALDEHGRLAGAVPRATLLPLATDARPDGRNAARALVDPRASALTGYVDRAPPRLSADARFHDVVDALRAHGYAVVVDADGRPLGVATPEVAALQVTAEGDRGAAAPTRRTPSTYLARWSNRAASRATPGPGAPGPVRSGRRHRSRRLGPGSRRSCHLTS